MKIFKAFLFLILTILMQSCYTGSILQTAKTTEKGKFQIVLGATAATAETEIDKFVLRPNGMLRFGTGNKTDLGFALAMGYLGHFRIDMKHQLVSWKDENGFLSSGLEFGSWLNEDTKMNLSIAVPLYMSFNHKGRVSPYVGQKITFGLTEWAHDQSYKKTSDIYYSGGLGLKWKINRCSIISEYAYTFNNYSTNLGEISSLTHYNNEFTIGILIELK